MVDVNAAADLPPVLVFTDDKTPVDIEELASFLEFTRHPLDALGTMDITKASCVGLITNDEAALRQMLDERAFERLQDVPFVMVTQAIADPELYDAVRALGPRAWLPHTASPQEIADALSGESVTATLSETKFIGVLGVAGGVGTTSVAISLASSLQETKNSARKRRVALIDLDFSLASCATRLDLEQDRDLLHFIQSPTAIDFGFLQTAGFTLDTGLFVLSLLNRHLPIDENGPAFVLQCLDATLGHFDYVVIDIPYYATSWFDDVIRNVDQLIYTALNSTDSLASLLELKRHVDLMRVPQPTDLILVNRVEKRFLRRANISAFHKILPNVATVLAWRDDITLGKAADTGMLPRQIARSSDFVNAMDELASLITSRLE